MMFSSDRFITHHALIPGDGLLLRNMPYRHVVEAIEKEQGYEFPGILCTIHHCAIVLMDPETKELMVYDARPLRSRKVLVAEYVETMKEWAAKEPDWRREENRPLVCQVVRPVELDAIQRIAILRSAENSLGRWYNMTVSYYLSKWFPYLSWALAWTRHCSNMLGRIQEAAGWCEWDKPYGEITPLDCLDVYRNGDFMFLGDLVLPSTPATR